MMGWRALLVGLATVCCACAGSRSDSDAPISVPNLEAGEPVTTALEPQTVERPATTVEPATAVAQPEATAPATTTERDAAGGEPEPEAGAPSTTTERDTSGGEPEPEAGAPTTTIEPTTATTPPATVDGEPEEADAPPIASTAGTESSSDTIGPSRDDREYPRFVAGPAPPWPFKGLVQLWYNPWGEAPGWRLRYWSWDQAAETYPTVELPGLEIDCLGQIALVSHGEHGIEIGGAPGAASDVYWIEWGTEAQLANPSAELLEEAGSRPSTVAVRTEGDWVHLGSGSGMRSYAMRDPARPDGERWRVQARHDGELFLMTVHPAHLPCYSGVSWLSLADTGDSVVCGANTAATVFVLPPGEPLGDLLLPDPAVTGTYLSCAPELDLQVRLPFTRTRELVVMPAQ